MSENSDQVICIHPVLETRGMVKEDGDSVYHISLKDCLACSGCAITEDEITLLSKQDPTIIFRELENRPGFNVVVSTMAISNLAAAKDWTAQEAYSSIHDFFMKKGASNVIHDGYIQVVWRQLLLDCFKQQADRPFIIPRCAGSIVYFERKTQYAKNLAQIKPFPQVYAHYIKKCCNNPNYLINLASCYDRKLEASRYPEEIDAVLTISEISGLLEKKEGMDLSFPIINDVEALLRAMNPNDKLETKTRRGIIEYTCGNLKGALVSGATANTILVKMLEQGSCPYDIIESNYCPFGCEAGGGLIRGESAARRKTMVAKTVQIHNSVIDNHIMTNTFVSTVANQICLEELRAEYKSIEIKQEEKEKSLDW